MPLEGNHGLPQWYRSGRNGGDDVPLCLAALVYTREPRLRALS